MRIGVKMTNLQKLAYNIGKRFDNKRLTVFIDHDFKETPNNSGGTRSAYSVHTVSPGEHLKVYLGVPQEISEKEKEIRIAHEFGEIAFRKKHPQISRILHRLGSKQFIGEIPRIINESLADMEARKKGFKIPYLYHLR
jgi:hypothetical protein